MKNKSKVKLMDIRSAYPAALLNSLYGKFPTDPRRWQERNLAAVAATVSLYLRLTFGSNPAIICPLSKGGRAHERRCESSPRTNG